MLLEQRANERFGEVARSKVALRNHGKKQKFGFKISAVVAQVTACGPYFINALMRFWARAVPLRRITSLRNHPSSPIGRDSR